MDTSHAPEPFRGMLLRHRGRTGLIQRDFAARAGVSHRSVQDWESGVNYPTAERLQAVIRVLFESGGLTAGREPAEARELWAAAEREAPRMHTPFDDQWFERLLAAHPSPMSRPASDPLHEVPAAVPGLGAVEPTVRVAPRGARVHDWGDAPDTVGFVGRGGELALLRSWVLAESCRLMAVLGMGGIGKTSLAARLAQEVAPTFERVYWRSLRDAPPVSEWLAGAIGFLSDQHLVPPSTESERIAVLLQLLRERRSLVVLDNIDTLFEPGQWEGSYRAGVTGYGRVMQTIAEAEHRSCLVLTSREAPPELGVLGGGRVRSFELGGLGVHEARLLLAAKELVGTSDQWDELTARFGGNGLALKVVGEAVRELCGGDIGAFFQETSSNSIFGGVRRLLSDQVERSSAIEQRVLRVLALEREPVRLTDLLAGLAPRVRRGAVVEAVEALRRRSLVERIEAVGAAAFTLQSVVLEYVTDRLVQDVADEIRRGEPVLLVAQPLIKAQAKEYVRQTQERLIGEPILQLLKAHYDEYGTEQRLLALLDGWRGRHVDEQDYGPGNVINLLRLLRGHLRELDLSRLTIRQAYLQSTQAQDVRLTEARLAETVLGDAFGAVVAVALSADGTLVAGGTLGGDVQAWRVADRTLVFAARGHVGAVWSVALSADGRLLASGGDDGTVRVWDVAGSRPLARLEGHVGGIWGVAVDAAGRLVASAGHDRTVRLWHLAPGGETASLVALEAHEEAVRWVALSDDSRSVDDSPFAVEDSPSSAGQGAGQVGRLLASGGNDGTVRLWEIRPGPDGTPRLGAPFAVLDGRAGGVIFGLALSGDRRSASSARVASAQRDGLRLWEISAGADGTPQPPARPPALLGGHVGMVFGVGLSADGRLMASGGMDGTVRLWDAESNRPFAILEGHSGTVHGVAISGDGRLVASGSDDCSVRLWDAESGRPLAVLEGQAGAVYGVALSADGRLLASGTDDGGVRLWDVESGRPLALLEGRAGAVYGVALSADGRLLASGTDDGGVRLWDVESGRPLVLLEGRAGAVHGVALSADGRLLASGENDGTVRLWAVSPDSALRRPLAVIKAHNAGAYGVALSADGRLLASGGDDGAVRVWEVAGGRPLAAFESHGGVVFGVALSADGRLLASGGHDGAVRLWDIAGHRALVTLPGHAGVVRAVAFSADGRLLASGSLDGTVKIWDTTRHALLGTLRPDRRFERLDITGLTGVTSAQRAALLALGAREHV